MSFLTRLLAPTMPAALNPLDDRYYGGGGALMSAAGTIVTPQTAMKIAAVWACVRVISDPLAAVPLITFRVDANGGRQRARGMPLYDVLHSRPNPWQTSLEWRKQKTAHALLQGNGLSRIVEGPRGPVDRLIPIHPDRLISVGQAADYTLRYKIRNPDGTTSTLLQDEVMHLRGLTLDGLLGVSVIDYARETMGVSLAAEQYAARYYSQNGTPTTALINKGKLSREARRRQRDEFEADTTGLVNAHRTAVFSEGVEPKVLSLSNQDSQFLETREFQVEDVARWFGVPLHMIQSTTKETSWGSGVEQMWLGFITGTLLFWTRAWEQTIERDLILDPSQFYSEFLLDALARGTLYERYQAYHLAVTDGVLTRNEIRDLENRNRIDGLDDPLQPAGTVRAGATAAEQQAAFEASAERASRMAAEQRYQRLAGAVAERVIRKEVTAMSRAAKHCPDPESWAQAVNEFYNDHAYFVIESLHLGEQTAGEYVEQQRKKLLADGPSAMDDWQGGRVKDLVKLACMEVSL